MKKMTKEQELKGAAELAAIETLEEDLVAYANLVSMWAGLVTKRYGLSSEALSMMLATLPSPPECVNAILADHRDRKAAQQS